MSNYMPRLVTNCLISWLFVFSVSSLRSCEVPVFRYALERWPVEIYEMTVYHRGLLSREQSKVVEALKRHSQAFLNHSNFIVRDIDLDVQPELAPQAFQLSLGNSDLPYLMVHYPGNMKRKRIIWSGPLSGIAARGITDSPVRRKIAGRILGGETAVWVLLESGDREKDDAAESVIKETLAMMEKKLELPEAVTGVAPQGAPDLRIDFSLVRLSRSDPEEKFLVRMLTRSEIDLEQYKSWPMAFPIYGRGRVLYALVGQGITEDNISEACAFLAGPCSCEIKDLNPGMDLLTLVDWEEGIGGSWVDAVGLPPLTGLASIVKSSQAEESDLAGNGSKNRLYRNIFLALGLVVALIALVSLKLLRSGKGDNK